MQLLSGHLTRQPINIDLAHSFVFPGHGENVIFTPVIHSTCTTPEPDPVPDPVPNPGDGDGPEFPPIIGV